MNRRMDRRAFVRTSGAAAAGMTLSGLAVCGTAGHRRQPNIVLIVADDLGYSELGCYGQERIRTPNIDRLAAEGMRFTQHYAGSPVCAPSRCVLLTGLHSGHAHIRDNDEMYDRGDVWQDLSLEGQRPLPARTTTFGKVLQEAGYSTGAIGKWGLGGPGSSGEPNRQGFDHWYGYLCQRVAHDYYPPYLWRNTEKHVLTGNTYYRHLVPPNPPVDPDDPASYAPYMGEYYAMDLMAEEALSFIDRNQDHPFLLYLPFIVPHLALQVPEDSLQEYLGTFEDPPYDGSRGYLPHRAPRAAYAAMITRMDREIGRIMDRLAGLGLDEDTVVFFTSDNGPTFTGGADTTFFRSAAPLRGLKQELYEGGIRVPLVARWPGRIPAGAVSDHLCGFQDFMPTLAELAGADYRGDTDGLSMLPTLYGDPPRQQRHEHLYWEFQGRQAIRTERWKAFRPRVNRPMELYDLTSDVAETTDVSAQYPEVVSQMEERMVSSRTPSELFPLVRNR